MPKKVIKDNIYYAAISSTLHGCSLLVDGHYKFQVASYGGSTVYC